MMFLLSGWVMAQEKVSVSWEDIQTRGLENNLQLKQAASETRLAEAELLEARALYIPNVKLSYTFMNTNNPMMAFGLKLNQKRIGQEDFNPAFLNHPNSITNFATQIEVQQPLINIDGFYERKAGKTKTEALKLQEERTGEYMEFEIRKTYLMLQLMYRVKETLEQAEITVLANQKWVEDYYDNGLVQKADVLDVGVRLKEIQNQLAKAESDLQNTSDYLFFLLNEDSENKVFEPQETLIYDDGLENEQIRWNENRKDLLAYEKSAEAYDYMIKSSGSKYLPRLNAFGNYELHDKEIAIFKNDNYMVGLQLSWDVMDGLKGNSQRRKYKAEKEKILTEAEAYSKQSQLELQKAYRDLRMADRNVSLTKQAWDQAKEAYRIRKNRFDEGLEKSTDLLLSETTMSQKSLEYQQAVFEYAVAKYYYRFLK